jgi:acyl-ACP thioesterase
MGRRTPARVIEDDFDRLPEVERAEFERSLEVRNSDLDINRHANNVSVIGWALESLPLDRIEGRQLADFEIEFRAETRGGDHVVTQAQASGGPTFLHRLARQGDQREIARARSVWMPGRR